MQGELSLPWHAKWISASTEINLWESLVSFPKTSIFRIGGIVILDILYILTEQQKVIFRCCERAIGWLRLLGIHVHETTW
jgi:hypothetical protein